VLNLAFSIRDTQRKNQPLTQGEGCWITNDYTSPDNKYSKALDLLFNDNILNTAAQVANMRMLMPPNMKTMIQKMGLRCISIGLKCIVPRIEDDSSD
jgi:hypothetical protein